MNSDQATVDHLAWLRDCHHDDTRIDDCVSQARLSFRSFVLPFLHPSIHSSFHTSIPPSSILPPCNSIPNPPDLSLVTHSFRWPIKRTQPRASLTRALSVNSRRHIPPPSLDYSTLSLHHTHTIMKDKHGAHHHELGGRTTPSDPARTIQADRQAKGLLCPSAIRPDKSEAEIADSNCREW